MNARARCPKRTEIIQYAQCENSTITMNIAQYVRQEQKRNCEIDMSKVEKVNQQCTEYICAVRKPT